jgi:hypothetical protein
MVLILFSVTVAGIVAAISIKRNRISVGRSTRCGIAKEDFSITGGSAGQLMAANPMKPFMVVVLPDGTIVTARIAGQV